MYFVMYTYKLFFFKYEAECLLLNDSSLIIKLIKQQTQTISDSSNVDFKIESGVYTKRFKSKQAITS